MRAWRALALSFLVVPLAPLLPQDATAADLGRPGGGRIASPQPLPPPIPGAGPFFWTGFYAGVHGGYGWSDIDWQEGGFSGSHDGEGWLAGGQIGFNLQSGRLVYGIEGDISASWIDGADDTCCGHSIDRLYSVRGRAGLASGDNRWLFYATGGVAWADIAYRSTGFDGHSEDAQFGWVAGGGIERALTPNWTARAEYLYYDFDSVTAPPGTLGDGSSDLDPTMHTVRLGVNYKF